MPSLCCVWERAAVVFCVLVFWSPRKPALNMPRARHELEHELARSNLASCHHQAHDSTCPSRRCARQSNVVLLSSLFVVSPTTRFDAVLSYSLVLVRGLKPWSFALQVSTSCQWCLLAHNNSVSNTDNRSCTIWLVRESFAYEQVNLRPLFTFALTLTDTGIIYICCRLRRIQRLVLY